MKCPSCSAAVEEGADLCLECGEPMGDSPAARAVRAEQPPAAGKAPAPARATPPPSAPTPSSEDPTAPIVRLPPLTSPKSAARPRLRRVEEPEPMRCPGCGIPSTRERCPGCGTILRRSDD